MSRSYWERRTLDRLSKSEQTGRKAIVRVNSLYNQALRNIEQDLEDLYRTYAQAKGVDRTALREIIKGTERANFLADIKRKISKAGFNISQVYDDKYLWRIDRLNSLKEKVKWEILSMGKEEAEVGKKTYSKVVSDSYRTISEDQNRQLGVSPLFNEINKETVDNLLQERWKGKNYSSRVWDNVSYLADELPTIIGGGVLMGRSLAKMNYEIRQRFGVSKSTASRLLRTETSHFHNQAELQAYKDDGITHYRYIAVADACSELCGPLDDQVFETKDAAEGVNYPTMHPNCRCTTVAVFLNELTGEERKPLEVPLPEEPEPQNIIPQEVVARKMLEGSDPKFMEENTRDVVQSFSTYYDVTPDSTFTLKTVSLDTLQFETKGDFLAKGVREHTHMESIKYSLEQLKKGKLLEPIIVDRAGKVIDGNHRVIAYQKMNIKEIPAYVADNSELKKITTDTFVPLGLREKIGKVLGLSQEQLSEITDTFNIESVNEIGISKLSPQGWKIYDKYKSLSQDQDWLTHLDSLIGADTTQAGGSEERLQNFWRAISLSDKYNISEIYPDPVLTPKLKTLIKDNPSLEDDFTGELDNINTGLRKGGVKGLPDYGKEVVGELDKTFNTSKSEEPVMLYRGIGETSEYKLSREKGARLTDEGYVFCSDLKGKAEQFLKGSPTEEPLLLEIQAPKGTRIMRGKFLGGTGDELVLDRGYEMEVIGTSLFRSDIFAKNNDLKYASIPVLQVKLIPKVE